MKWLLNQTRGDFVIWTIVVVLSVFSLLAVYSSTGTLAYRYQAGNTEYYLFKHLLLLLFGIAIMYLCHLINYRYYSRIAQILLYLSIPLLILTYIFGVDIHNAKRWLVLPGVNITFQTSDLAKIALIMYTARMLSKKQGVIKEFKEAFLPITGAILLICGLIAPSDLSTAGLLFTTCILLLFIGRVNIKYMAILGLSGILIISVYIGISSFGSNQGRIHTWKNRIESYLSEEGNTYQSRQAKIAIASGNLMGKGPGNSTQRNFLPNPYSDFIYAIIIEEYGLLGGLFVIFLYLVLLYRSIRIVIKSPGAFGALLAVGLSLSLVLQAMIHAGVNTHLLPVTGLTLPLVSMGGTSLWFTSISLGIILSVSRYIEEEEEKTKTLYQETPVTQAATG